MDWGDSTEGGFVNSDEPQQLISNVSVGGEERVKNVAACSIAQIMKFTRPNEGLILYGKKIYHINLVALILEVLDISPQKVHLLLDDYTSGGPLEVTHIVGDFGTPGEDSSYGEFQTDSDGPKRLSDLQVGDYVRCVGVVKYNQDKANLVAYHLRYVDDPNEVTMHTLEVIRDAMFYERQQQGTSVSTTRDFGQAATSHNPMYNQNQQVSGNNNFGSLSNRDKHLLKFLREKGSDSGISIDDILRNFKGFSKKDIEDSLQLLTAEGLCWQGDSEDHWCADAKEK